MESQDTSTETEKKEAVNINETDFGISQPQPEKLEDSNLEIFEDTETMEVVPDISETSDHQEAEVVQETQTETPQESFQESTQEVQTETPKESFQESYQEAQTEARRKDSQESTREVRKEALPDSPPDHQEAFQPGSQNQKTTATRFFQGISQRRSRRDSLGPPARYLSESNRLRMRRRLRDSGNQTAGYRASAAGKLGVWK